ncbi:MAG: transporter [Microbacteriaceae bacterium]|nr:transporter [Microbacteriaceae bacterium]
MRVSPSSCSARVPRTPARHSAFSQRSVWYTKAEYRNVQLVDTVTAPGSESAATATRTLRPRPWLMLAIGVAAQASGTVVVSTPALLIPQLRGVLGLDLAQAGLLAALPTFGMVLTLVAWGGLTDRYGERWILSGGLLLTVIAAAGAAISSAFVDRATTTWPILVFGLFLTLAGMAAASTNAASGRVVIGWFPARRRGLAMGIRQTCQPLGVAIAAVTVPHLAASDGIGAAFLLGAAMTLASAVACAAWIVNPPRPAAASQSATGNPYRSGSALWRIHLASALLVVPQFALSTFGLVWLVSGQGWTPLAAGILLGVAQFGGALGRIGIGLLSDRLGARLRPLRWVAFGAMVTMALVAAAGESSSAPFVAVAYLLATCASVADNGLAYTAVAEIAGRGWSGRALGAQNTGQFLAASAVGPGLGALIGLIGFPAAFLAAALAPLIAVPIVPPASADRVH